MRNQRKTTSGITLIALVITIIVLLILAGVSIVTLTGDNGILQQAETAKIENAKAGAREQIEVEVMGSYGKNGEIDKDKLKDNLNNLGINTTDDDTASEWEVTHEGYKFKINLETGEVTYVEEGSGGGTGDEATFAEITGVNYGDYIDYPVDLNDDGDTTNDWRIFYKDNSGNVFIIAADYLKNSKLPAEADMGNFADSEYASFWPSSDYLTRSGSAAISEEVANKYMLSWRNTYPTSENRNIKAVAALLDTSAWSSFASGVSGAEAIGGPTLEMYIASWNAKGYTTLYCNNSTETGYYVGDKPNPTTELVIISSDTKGYSDTLYYPHKSSYDSCEGYWLASPSVIHPYSVNFVYYKGYVDSYYYSDSRCGVRPVVCLPSGTQGTKGEDGVWTIQ